jgi:hypothetical protein
VRGTPARRTGRVSTGGHALHKLANQLIPLQHTQAYVSAQDTHPMCGLVIRTEVTAVVHCGEYEREYVAFELPGGAIIQI